MMLVRFQLGAPVNTESYCVLLGQNGLDVNVVASLARFHVFTRPVSRERLAHMTRTTVTFSISVPPEMAGELEEIRKKEHRTRSELIREALRRYIEDARPPSEVVPPGLGGKMD